MFMKRALAIFGATALLISVLTIPAGAQGYEQYGCLNFYANGVYTGSRIASLDEYGLGDPFGLVDTHGHLAGGACLSSANGYHVEAGSYQYRWSGGKFVACRLGYSNTTFGLASAITTCPNSVAEKLYFANSIWVYGIRRDSTWVTITLPHSISV